MPSAPSAPERERHQRTVGALALTNFVLGLPVPPLFFWSGDFENGLVALIYLGSFLVVPVLIRRGYFEAARMLLTLLGTIIILFYAAMLGRSGGVQVLLFTNACLPLVLASRAERTYLAVAIALPIVGWVALELSDYDLLPKLQLAAGWHRIFRRALFPVAMLGLLNHVFYFFRFFHQSQRKLDRLHRALWTDLHFARELQLRLLPRSLETPSYTLAARMLPTTEVGGDYYDLLTVGDRAWLAIGDVSGHGVTSGLIAMMVQTSLRAALAADATVSPAALVTQINRATLPLLEQLGADRYMTLTILCCTPEGRIVFAGRHQDLLVYRAATRTVEARATNGIWLGLQPDISAQTFDEALQLGDGDRLLLFTDGIIEATQASKALVDQPALEQWFETACRATPEPSAILDHLVAAQRAYTQHDDQTWLVVAPRGSAIRPR